MLAFYEDGLARLTVPYESHYVDTRYGRTHMLLMGPPGAPPLIMVQGMAGSSILWHLQVADFSQHFRLYALDTVGQPGRSAPNPPSLFDDSYVDWLVDVLDGLKLQKAHFIGVSLGAWAIMRLGILHPERLDRAILLSPMGLARGKMHVRRWIPNPTNRRKGSDDDLTAELQERSFNPSDPNAPARKYDRQLARAMALATKHYRVDLSMGVKPDASRLGKMLMFSRVMLKFMSATPEAQLRRFRKPALLVLGEHEMLYDPQRAIQRAKATMPQLDTVVVPGAGHAAIYERPEYTNPLIVAYLKGESIDQWRDST
jgi:pimeloyl-ACP methyl ester carboxylesterase